MLNEFEELNINNLTCSCCEESNNSPEFEELLSDVKILRSIMGVPFKITRSYQCLNHPDEIGREVPSQFNKAAIELSMYGKLAYDTLEQVIFMDCFTGIGLNQKGPQEEHFIQLDQRPADKRTLYTYD